MCKSLDSNTRLCISYKGLPMCLSRYWWPINLKWSAKSKNMRITSRAKSTYWLLNVLPLFHTVSDVTRFSALPDIFSFYSVPRLCLICFSPIFLLTLVCQGTTGRWSTISLHDVLSSTTYFEARLDNRHRQHKDAGHWPSSAPEQHGLHSSRAPVLEEVLLQGVVGAEVDPHTRNGPGKWLQEQMSKVHESTPLEKESWHAVTEQVEGQRWRPRLGTLTGEMPFHSPRSRSVFTTLRTTVTMPTRPTLAEREQH